jgi:hypothetical protein
MSDWGAVNNALNQGFERGTAAGGKLSGLGMALSKVANSMKESRVQGEELAQKKNLLGYASELSMQEKAQEAQLAPKEWKPRSQEEALSFESAKEGIKAQNPKTLATAKRQNLIDSTKIREEFINRPEVKEYVTINTEVKSMDSLLSKAKSGNLQNQVALDQALISMYNKLTDPNSVVRESEYARTGKNLPIANRFSGAIEKLQKGGAGITNADREALVWGAKIIADERGKTFNSTLDNYSNLADEYGIDKSLITRGIEPHKAYEESSDASGSDMVPVRDLTGKIVQMRRQDAIAMGAK